MSQQPFRYSDGSAMLVGDKLLFEKGRTPGVIELIVVTTEDMHHINVDAPGIMLRSPPFGLVYLPRWTLDEDPPIFVARSSS